jgi:MFS family permease
MSRTWPLYLCVFGDLLGFAMIIPDIQFRAGSFGAKGWLIGAMLGTMFIVQVLVSGAWGRVADRIGRKRVIVICTLLSALSMAFYAHADSIAWLFLSRATAGLGAANVAAASAYVSSTVGGDQRAVSLGRLSAFQTAGLVVGPSLGGFVGDGLGSQWVGWIGAATSLLVATAVAVFLPRDNPASQTAETETKRSRFGVLIDFPSVRPIAAIAVVAWFSLAMLEGTFGRLIQDNLGLGRREFGWIFSYESILQVSITAFGLAWLIKRMSEANILRAAYLLQGLGLALFPLAPNLVCLFAASTLYAPGSALATPTLNTLVSRIVPEDRHGEMFGTLQSARSLGFILGPMLGGAMFDWHHSVPYFFAGGVCVVACLMVSRVVAVASKPEPQSA